MSHLDALEQDLRDLKLTRLADQLQGFLASAAKQEWDYGTFLGNVVKEELAARRDRRTEIASRMGRLPFVKTIENFDFAYQPSINAKQFKELSAVRWIANGENLILLGTPGAGKTHPCRRSRDQGNRTGVQDPVHLRAGADRLPGPGQHREPAGGAAQTVLPGKAADR